MYEGLCSVGGVKATGGIARSLRKEDVKNGDADSSDNVIGLRSPLLVLQYIVSGQCVVLIF